MEGEPTSMRIIREGFIQRLFGLDFRERCQIVVHNRNKDTGRKRVGKPETGSRIHPVAIAWPIENKGWYNTQLLPLQQIYL